MHYGFMSGKVLIARSEKYKEQLVKLGDFFSDKEKVQSQLPSDIAFLMYNSTFSHIMLIRRAQAAMRGQLVYTI